MEETTGAMNEVTIDNSSIYENVSEDMTFDNLDEGDETPIESKGFDDEESEDEPKEEKEEGEEVETEELKLLNDTDGKEKKAEKEEEKKEETKKEEPKEEDKTIPKEAVGEGKKLKVRIGEELYSLDSSAQIPVKIDGKKTEVPLQELINKYSGNVKIESTLNELAIEKKTLTREKEVLQSEKSELIRRFKPIIDKVKDPTADPFEALELLVDVVGADSYDIYKRSLEARLDEIVNLGSMTEAEQKAYFLEKQNQRLLKQNEKRSESEKQALESKQLRAQVDQIRQTYKVSEEQYSEAFDELTQLVGQGKFSYEDVADFASIKPIYPEVSNMLEPYRDEIDDSELPSVVADFSRSLRDGKITKQQLEKVIKETFGVPEVVKELNTKLNYAKKPETKKAVESKTDAFESFDDLFE